VQDVTHPSNAAMADRVQVMGGGLHLCIVLSRSRDYRCGSVLHMCVQEAPLMWKVDWWDGMPRWTYQKRGGTEPGVLPWLSLSDGVAWIVKGYKKF
jgi:hypothetical protein